MFYAAHNIEYRDYRHREQANAMRDIRYAAICCYADYAMALLFTMPMPVLRLCCWRLRAAAIDAATRQR